ncbi:uncharacterized protein LOC125579745 [Brassica napus]|uniref:uncharacterized protein LOC125579745 n=1 Tax=Brassica napus TaxID=3708 RepID=UPI002078C86B|nr:uncharacterized protein LOC125579745 [Brassica napus]
MSKVFPRWQFLSNHQSDPDGRIIFLWRHLASVKFVSQSRQSLTTEVTLPNHPPITITSIYASNLAEERIDLWAELINTQHQLSLHLKPWLVAGYFNQITHPSEHSSPTVQALSSSMIHFRDTLLQLGLFDLRYQGIFNTWSNKQPVSFVTRVRALQDPTAVNFEEEKTLHDKWMFLQGIEEAYFRQRSRINWLKEGDFKTSYFHRVAVVCAAINTIRSFLLSNGSLITDPEEMSLIPYRCSPEACLSLSSIPDAPTITKTILKLNPNKSSGPDGLTSGFFKGFMSSAVNSTILTMVPKHPGASAVGDYMPISCCSTLYKAVSKILVSKLKPLLPDLILPNQTAFVKGRLLVENTVPATELVNGYHKSVGPKKVVIKVDIVKAFDTISWTFVLNCLSGIGVPPSYIRLVEASITTTSFTVGYNGQVHGYFKGKRGLRQGDPLSPYLFVIAMNCLSMFLDKGAEEGRFSYHDKCAPTKLMHLCFSSDLLIFTDGAEISVKGVLEILEQFKSKSGLAVSIQKTAFYSSGLSSHEINMISSSTGLTHGSLPICYLGVPLNSKKLSLLNCEPLLNQVKSKVNTWSAQSLSFAGRLLLVNTVIAVLDGSLSNFWTKKPSQKHSWLANKLLRIRDIAYPVVKVKLGNGARTRFWTDNWIPFGSLEAFLSPVISRRMGVPANAMVKDINANGNWNIRSLRTDNLVIFQTYLTGIFLTEEEDTYEWEVDGVVWKDYSTSAIYKQLKHHAPLVPWFDIIWYVQLETDYSIGGSLRILLVYSAMLRRNRTITSSSYVPIVGKFGQQLQLDVKSTHQEIIRAP